MTSIKKFAWGSTAVAVALFVAMAMMLQTAQAATITVTAQNYLIGSSVPTNTLIVSVAAAAGNSAVANGGTITVTFPAGTTFGSGATTAANWDIDDTAAGGGGNEEPPASVTVNGTALVFTLDGSSAIDATEGWAITTRAAGLIKFGSTSGSISVVTASDSGSAALTLTGVTVTASPTSIFADGVSSSTISIAAAGATNAGADTISIVATGGSFIGGTAGGAGTAVAAFAVLPTAGAPLTTVTGTTGTGALATTATTLTYRAATTTGSFSVTVYVTPVGGGNAQIAGAGTITLTAPTQVAPGLPASGSVSPTTATNVTLTGTSPTISATWVDANGNAPISGGTVTVNTTLGILANVAGLTCVNQSCTGTLPVGGVVSVTLTGGGVAGTATITFTTNGVAVTKTVTITGAVDTLTAAVQADADGAGAGTTFVAAANPGSTTFGAGGGVRVSVDPKDTAGNRVPGISPAITVSPGTCATVGATTASTSTAAATTVLTAGSAAVGTSCTVTATSGTKSTTTTFTIGSALASTSTLEITAEDMATVATQTVTVAVKSSAGVPVQDGTSVTLVVSAGAVATSTVQTVNGVASFTYVSPGTAQQVNLTAVAGSVTASKAIGVGVAGPSTGAGEGDGTFASAPAFGDGNVGSAVFNGGSIDQLAAAVTAAGGTSVWVQGTDGNWYRYNTLASGATAFVNNAFIAQFEDGLGTVAVFVVK